MSRARSLFQAVKSYIGDSNGNKTPVMSPTTAGSINPGAETSPASSIRRQSLDARKGSLLWIGNFTQIDILSV